MFGGKKKRRDQEQQAHAQPPQGQATGQSFTLGEADSAVASISSHPHLEALMQAALARNPAIAANPALAASLSELLHEAASDPQALRKRIHELAAASGHGSFTLTPEGLRPLLGTAGGASAAAGQPAQGAGAGTTAAFPPAAQPQESQASPGFGQPGSFQQEPIQQEPFQQEPFQQGSFQQSFAQAGEAGHGNPLKELDKLAERYNRGELTTDQFEAEKRRLLGG
jgi:putative oligomerization/nucleic acid binding protein